MKNLMILIRSFFLLRPRFLSTIFFIPILYGIGWALSQPLLLFNFEKENLSLIGTIFTFFLFIFYSHIGFISNEINQVLGYFLG